MDKVNVFIDVDEVVVEGSESFLLLLCQVLSANGVKYRARLKGKNGGNFLLAFHSSCGYKVLYELSTLRTIIMN